MKTIVSILVIAIGLGFTSLAFAQDVSTPKTEGECQQTGGLWHPDTATCTP
jgi:hypothetical protein